MTFQQELSSWLSPPSIPISPTPTIGSLAPSSPKLSLPTNKPTIIVFLRHCGCPFAEATFLHLRTTATKHPDITCIAASHSDQPSTDKWLEAIGGAGPVQVIVDPSRESYAAWGLGVSNLWHIFNPYGPINAWKAWKEEGIWKRPTESGNRWQTAGNFGLDEEGVVKWGQAAPRADSMPDFEEAVRAVQIV